MTFPPLEQEVLAGTCAGLLCLAVLLWAWTRGRHEHRDLATTSPAVMESLRLAAGPAYRRGEQTLHWTTNHDPESTGDDDQVRVVNPQTRALLLHIRSLEATLEEQYAEHERIRKELAVELDDARRHDGARALSTVMALRPRLAGEPGDIAVARVEAALARLSAPSAFSRPPLVLGATAGAPPPLAGPAHPHLSAVSADAGADPRASQGAGSAAVPPPAVVLPVPVRAAQDVTTTPRRARWRRRRAS